MIPWLIAGVSLPFLALLAGRPVARRLATRSLGRRPAEAVLVVAGSMLATAIITGSLLVGDTVDRSIRSQAYDQLGPIDEVVGVIGLDEGRRLWEALEGFASPQIDGTLPMVIADAAAVVGGASPRAQPTAQLIEVDFAAAARFGGDPQATGMSGATPVAGHAAVSEDLAAKLGIGAGDALTVHAYRSSLDLRVDRVMPRTGIAGFWATGGQRSYNVFVSPGTIGGLAAAASVPGTEPPKALVAVSNAGDVEEGAALTDEVTAQLRAELGDLPAAVRPAKRTVLDIAESVGSSLGDLYFTVGMFAVAAGILLLVNIFVMLADERRHELGMMRAIGLRRAPMVGQFATEGWIYAAVSAAVGALVGIAVGWIIAWRSGEILSSGREVDSLQIEFTLEWASVARGFAIGFLLSLLTIVVTSARTARLNVIAAIRDLPDARSARPRRRQSVAGGALALGGSVWALRGAVGPDAYGVVLGPAIGALGLGLVAARHWLASRVITVAGLFVLGWAILAVPVLGSLDVNIDIPIFLAQGLTLVAAAVAVVTVHQATVGRVLGRLTGGSLAVRIGLAYPLARSFRTAMTLGMIAIVVLTLTYISILSTMFAGQIDEMTAEASGGFEVVVQSNLSDPVPMDQLAEVDGVDAVAPIDYTSAEFVLGSDQPVTWAVSGFGDELVGRGPPALSDLGSHASAADAWRATLDDPGLVIVDEYFLITEAGPPSETIGVGDTLTLRDIVSGNERRVTVTALVPGDMLGNGAFYGERGLDELTGGRVVASRALVSTATPDAVVEALRSRFMTNGIDTDTIRDRVEIMLSMNTGFFTLMEQYVGAGLVVGMAGIGVIMVRAVRERRREIGVLRSLGFPTASVARAFVVEAGFVAVEGLVIGMATAAVASYGLTATGASWAEGLRWSLPVPSLAVIAALTLAAALAASLWPARTASRIPPAVALRLAD